LVEDIEAGRPLHPTRGADVVAPFKAVEHVLAGFPDGHVDEGPGAGENSLLGLRIAEERGWHAPVARPGDPQAPATATEGEDK
ncbi:MAG: NADH-quinone oxidoreductase subunit E, partial [Propionibacterium sp.]|nr:NADH-quinone oxidoreductase subunit E [Propionibacterium sp.]